MIFVFLLYMFMSFFKTIIIKERVKKDIIIDGLNKTTYMKDDMEGKIAIKEQVDVTSHLKHNKRLLTLNDGYSKSRDLKE